MKTNILLLIIIVLTLLFSCIFKQEEKHGYEEGNDNAMAMELSAPPSMDESVKSYPPETTEEEAFINSKDETVNTETTDRKKKIIKDGSIAVSTNDLHTSKKNIDSLLKTLTAYYESEDLQNNNNSISYDLKIRVPANNFERFISSIENGQDEIKSKSIQVRDVTEEYVDIETRLTNKREYLKRYTELLSKASTIKDILVIEEHIRALQEEIESKVGRLKYINDQVSFSTLNITLYQEKEYVYKPQPQDKFSERVKTSVSNGWKLVVDFVLWLITIWPFLILTLVGFFLIRRLIKKRKSRQSEHS